MSRFSIGFDGDLNKVKKRRSLLMNKVDRLDNKDVWQGFCWWITNCFKLSMEVFKSWILWFMCNRDWLFL